MLDNPSYLSVCIKYGDIKLEALNAELSDFELVVKYKIKKC